MSRTKLATIRSILFYDSQGHSNIVTQAIYSTLLTMSNSSFYLQIENCSLLQFVSRRKFFIWLHITEHPIIAETKIVAQKISGQSHGKFTHKFNATFESRIHKKRTGTTETAIYFARCFVKEKKSDTRTVRRSFDGQPSKTGLASRTSSESHTHTESARTVSFH